MIQPKVSNRFQFHTLSCTPPSTISIYDAWEYIYYCKYTHNFTDEELHELEDSCNFESSCRYEKSRTRHRCHRRYRWTKSKIRYYCVYYHDDKSTTPVTVSSNKSVKVTTSEIANTQSSVSTSSTENYLTSSNSGITPLEQTAGKTNVGVIAGSVFGILGVLALLLLFLYCFLKRRKAIKQNDTSTRNTTHAVGQNSNILYVVPENISSHTHDPPPAYTNPYDNPDRDHIYINNEAITSKNSERQQANDYNHIHGAHINNSIQNDDYNHTYTGLNLSGHPVEDYNHISVSGRNVSTENQMDDGYNHIRNTEDMSHSIDDYNHINGQTGRQENNGYLNDDYNHLAYSNGQKVPDRKQMTETNDLKQISNEASNSKNDYANIGIEERNNDTVNFEPDDTYVYS